ncbi:hypothetical protein [Streptomyces himalayensis]|uniref:Uncharacterized protein n=1 Tax=Streptomyces himalayensis subsp. himalayensis TaxID=2756131 RepID=A0A7W0DRW9_9ACTN|nr:hypothetical protein [Streptomyces himalayensis subsp. himalayensis]
MASVLALSAAAPAASAAPQISAPTASPVQAQPSFVNGWCGRDPYGCRFGTLGAFGNNLGFFNNGFNNGFNGFGGYGGYGCVPRVVTVGYVTVVTC